MPLWYNLVPRTFRVKVLGTRLIEVIVCPLNSLVKTHTRDNRVSFLLHMYRTKRNRIQQNLHSFTITDNIKFKKTPENKGEKHA